MKTFEEVEQRVKDMMDDAKKQAYDNGYEAGLIANVTTGQAYNDGLNDAWEAVRKLYLNGKCKDMFGEFFNEFIQHHTAQEAITMIETYNSIRVGDEVQNKMSELKCVVLGIDGIALHGLTSPFTPCVWDIADVTKTGRHFPQVEQLLKEMAQ